MTDPADIFAEWTAETGGALPFETWMRRALHHPRLGYYATRIRTVGRRGDFATAATLHRALGEAVAAWAARRSHELSRRGPLRRWHLVEVGPGTGELAQAVLDALPLRARFGLVYHLVETSLSLGMEQRTRLAALRPSLRALAGVTWIRWHDRIEEALDEAGGRALVFSSELVDAFPVTAVRWHRGGWQELCLGWDGSAWRETWRRLEPVRLRGAACSLLERAPRLPEGQRGELGLAAREWLLGWAPALREGAVLTLDYGGRLDDLLDRRPGGTLRAYFHHQRIEGPAVLERFGRQDVTADVNFDDLMRWGEEAGLATARLESQREFLLRYRPDLESRAAREPEVAYLLHPAGAGGAFLALEQSRREV